MKETGVVVTASWYNLKHTLALTSPQPNCAQHAIGHCLPLTGLHPSDPLGIAIAIVRGHNILNRHINAPKIQHV
jgi:hypothetical protein